MALRPEHTDHTDHSDHADHGERRLARLVDELSDVGLELDGGQPWHRLAVTELDYALRPMVHERRIPTYGALIDPTTDPTVWQADTQLDIDVWPVDDGRTADARRYADGRASWLVRRVDRTAELAVFSRPASSERDLVVVAEALGAVVVQRHPSGPVRLVGDFGVYRWDAMAWHHEPPLDRWIGQMCQSTQGCDPKVLAKLLEFAVHDLGARGIGATLVYRPDATLVTSFDDRLDRPPPLRITHSSDLAPLRHVLTQIDGAALFSDDGTLQRLGVRLVPTPGAEADVDGLGGTRHTSGRRYSYDDPSATVIVVSEDGPVTVLRAGAVVGTTGPGNRQV